MQNSLQDANNIIMWGISDEDTGSVLKYGWENMKADWHFYMDKQRY